MTNKHDVDAARREAEKQEIERKSRLAKWNDYVGFFTAKALGFAGLTGGGIELISPELLSIIVPQPAWVAAAGLALLTGKDVIRLISAIEDALEGRK